MVSMTEFPEPETDFFLVRDFKNQVVAPAFWSDCQSAGNPWGGGAAGKTDALVSFPALFSKTRNTADTTDTFFYLLTENPLF